jgi:hypothetical protein
MDPVFRKRDPDFRKWTPVFEKRTPIFKKTGPLFVKKSIKSGPVFDSKGGVKKGSQKVGGGTLI